MRIDINNPESWYQLNESVAKVLKVFSKGSYQIRAYKGVAHAVMETVMGLGQFYSHKKSMGLVSGNSPDFTVVRPYLLKESFQVQNFSFRNVQEIIDDKIVLHKDTSFFCFSSDNPVTAEFWDWKILDQYLDSKKIFSIRVSHFDWILDYEILPYSVSILSVSPELAIAVCGSKFRPPPLFSSSLHWENQVMLARLKTEIENRKINIDAIQNFENNLNQGWNALIQNPQRVYDRALIYHPRLSADTLLLRLGAEKNVQTTNTCHWGKTRLFDEWWDSKPSDEILRGLLALNLDLIQKKNFKEILFKVTEDELKKTSY